MKVLQNVFYEIHNLIRNHCTLYQQGANLTFRSVDHNLPESVKQNPVLTLRVISIDEAAMDFLK